MYFESIPLYFESILLYFATMLASGCIDTQYSKGKEKVVINIHCKDALAVGDTTYAYFVNVTFEGFGPTWRAQRWFGDVFGGRFSECVHSLKQRPHRPNSPETKTS